MIEAGIAALATVTYGLLIHHVLSARDKATSASAGLLADLSETFGNAFGPLFRERMPELSQRYDEKIKLSGAIGLPRDGARFAGAAFGFGLVMFVLILPVCLVGGTGLVLGLFLSLVFGAIGFIGGVRYLDRILESRTKALDREFPYFLDFVVMTKQAGAILADSISLFVEAAGKSVLGGEMRTLITTTSKGPGGLLGALAAYRDTCPSESGRNALMAIIAVEPVGAENSETLSSLASDMRFARKQRGERAAESIKSSIMVPVTVMLAGVMIIILAGSLPNILFGF